MQSLFRSDAGGQRRSRSPKGYAASLILHIAWVVLLALPPGLLLVLPAQKLRKEQIVKIPLKPPKVLEAQRRKPPKPKLPATPAITTAPPPPPPARPPRKPAKDDSFVIEDDHTREIPKVLARQQGHIGFGEPDDNKYVRYIFGADGAREHEREPYISMGEYWVIEITDEEGWDLIERLRQQNHLSGNMVLYALFPPEMQARVSEEIRRVYQEKQGTGSTADIEHMKVTLAFDDSVPLGFRITDLVVRSEP